MKKGRKGKYNNCTTASKTKNQLSKAILALYNYDALRYEQQSFLGWAQYWMLWIICNELLWKLAIKVITCFKSSCFRFQKRFCGEFRRILSLLWKFCDTSVSKWENAVKTVRHFSVPCLRENPFRLPSVVKLEINFYSILTTKRHRKMRFVKCMTVLLGKVICCRWCPILRVQIIAGFGEVWENYQCVFTCARKPAL